VITWVAVAAAITLFSWQTFPLTAQAGLDGSWNDASWQAALQMALQRHVSFGSELIFTYGPLGFLSVPTLWYSSTGALAFLYALLGRVALASALFAGARRSYGAVAGALIALLLMAAISVVVTGFNDGVSDVVAFVVFAVWVVDRVVDRRRLLTMMAIGGAAAGLELLNKESIGLEITALAAVMAVAARGRRRENLAVAIVALIVAVLVGWGVTGQSLNALPDYFRGAAQIVSGYAAAMSFEQPGLGWEYAAAWVAFAFGLAAALSMTADGNARRRWGIVALWVTFCFFQFKEGFVRHDSVHALIFFDSVLGGFVALRWRPKRRGLGVTMTAALVVFALAAASRPFSSLLTPTSDANALTSQINQLTSSSARRQLISASRQAVEAAYPIDPMTMALLRGHSVHVAPDQAAVAWAYRLSWRPLPVFQSYSVYTPALDRDNANALSSRSAPQRILRNTDPPIDGRVLSFDEPLATRTMLCRYRQLRATAVWQVLGAGPNRCTAAVLLGAIKANWGEAVSVPPPPNPHSFVFVDISGVQVDGFGELADLLDKPATRTVVLDGTPFRLVEGTAGDGLLLRAAAGADYPPPFNLAPNATTIAVEKGDSNVGSGDPLRFSFYAQSVARAPASPAG
jgi:hypothetical protein